MMQLLLSFTVTTASFISYVRMSRSQNYTSNTADIKARAFSIPDISELHLDNLGSCAVLLKPSSS